MGTCDVTGEGGYIREEREGNRVVCVGEGEWCEVNEPVLVMDPRFAPMVADKKMGDP